MPIIILLGLFILVLVTWAVLSARRRRRRARLLCESLPPEWREVLERNVSQYRRLPADLQRALEGLVNVFLDDKEIAGCAGLEVTDEMRLTVAGHACLLLLGGGRSAFSGFHTILMYPDTFVAPATSYDGLVETVSEDARSGESWQRGPVVLAWSDIREDLRHAGDGRNVVLHEFAHKLDEENDQLDGLPVLRDRSQYEEWRAVLSREYDELKRQAEKGSGSTLDPYGAESPAEFFAVATEAFFEMPATLRDRLPDLYHQLQRYYNLDPAGWRC